MSLSGRVWPAPPLIHCICLRVIPHPHLFNFTRQSFLCVFLLLSHKILITHGLCFGREEIDGCDQCLEERESWGNAGTRNYCSTFITFYVCAFISGLERLQSQAVCFPKGLKKLDLSLGREPPLRRMIHDKWMFLQFFYASVKHSKVYIWEQWMHRAHKTSLLGVKDKTWFPLFPVIYFCSFSYKSLWDNFHEVLFYFPHFLHLRCVGTVLSWHFSN